ncbi:hypothetical protein ACJ5NV_07910 [Loktanella agnita]|uniref:hypothetical protein n=1 Tax=Loktanella agnita TaxID=287097 RepID=UPI003986DA9E
MGIDNGPGGYRMALGRFDNDDTMDYRALAMLQSTTRVSGPISGTVSYNANYRIMEVQNVGSNPVFAGNNDLNSAGQITMTANFADQAMTGTSDLLTIDATLNAETFEGTVTWRGVDGDITGLASDSFMIGAFHGHDNNAVFTGGISGDADAK